MTFGWFEPEPVEEHLAGCAIWTSDDPCNCDANDPHADMSDPDGWRDARISREAS